MAKTLIKILKQNFCQKCSECQDLSLESFWGYACFCPIQNGQNFETILSKMLRTTTFMVEFLWGYEYFHSIQNGQNNCKSFETKIFVENAQNVEIYQWNFFEVMHVFTTHKMA